MSKHLMVFAIIAGLMFSFSGVVGAFEQRVGFHLGTVTYQDDIGEVYKEDPALGGIQYNYFFIPFFSVAVQYDLFTVSTGNIYLYDNQGRIIDRLDTELAGSLLAVTPTIHFRFHPRQVFVPNVGVGFSFFRGEQQFDRSENWNVSNNDFSGTGFNLGAGMEVLFNQRVGIEFCSKAHFLNVEVVDSAGRTRDETNFVAEYYGGFFVRFAHD